MGSTEEEFLRVKAEIDKLEEKNLQRIRQQQEKDKKKIEEKKEKKKDWSRDDFAMLAKALNKFPPGTQDRWRTIATFMGTQYTSKDVIEMAKQLTEKKALANAGKGAFKDEPDKIIKTGDAKAEQIKKQNSDDSNWTEEDQKLLEQALKKYPKTLPPKERWGSIAKEVPGKTPKECLARFKEI